MHRDLECTFEFTTYSYIIKMGILKHCLVPLGDDLLCICIRSSDVMRKQVKIF